MNETVRARLPFYALLSALIVVPLAIVLVPLLWHPQGRAPDFTLRDQSGQTFTLSGQRGRGVVLFFGYTHCPDVCPTTLAALARAYRSLGSPEGIKVAMITVDPRRDSPPTLRAYVALFDRHFSGLTGDERTLAGVYKAYGVYRRLDPDPSSALGYSVTHSGSVYVIDRAGNLVDRIDWDSAPQVFAGALRRVTS